MRIHSENREDLVEELDTLGAHLVSLNPVRATLEDLVMSHYEGKDS